MVNTYIINIHSIVDVITNSSTELFILDEEKSLELIKDILTAAIDLYNKIESTNNTFTDIFKEPYYGLPSEALRGWEDYYKSRIKNKKAIILRGTCDNSIPEWIQTFIKTEFNCERFHLG